VFVGYLGIVDNNKTSSNASNTLAPFYFVGEPDVVLIAKEDDFAGTQTRALPKFPHDDVLQMR